jgi:hypothetical protein
MKNLCFLGNNFYEKTVTSLPLGLLSGSQIYGTIGNIDITDHYSDYSGDGASSRIKHFQLLRGIILSQDSPFWQLSNYVCFSSSRVRNVSSQLSGKDFTLSKYDIYFLV